jgi:hypothetical protein
MQQFFDVVQTRSGAAIADVRVTVYNSSGGAATLYSDNGVTPKANPVITNADGEYFFYAANGTYSAAFSSSAYVNETRTGILLYDPADGTFPSSQVAYIPAGTSAVATTVQTKLRESVSVKDFGAVGDGVTDDTAAIQAAINSLSTNQVLTGLNGTYVTTSLLLKSYMIFRDVNLITKAGTTDFVAPITINGVSSPKTNIGLINVNVNGNRVNQTGTFDPSENGGRHGFRINGFVSNLTMLNCSANYCAGDGASFFSSTAKPSADTYTGLCFQNIYIQGCTFNYNRRNGISIDSLNGLKIIGCNAKYNGTNVSTSAGIAPGAPIDFEGYGVGTAIHEVEIDGGDFTSNAGKFLIYETVSTSDTGFLPRKNIRIANARFNVPNSASDGCISIYGPNSNVAGGNYVYENIELTGCRFDNWIEINGVKGLSVSGGSVNGDYASNTYYANLTKSKNWHFNIRSSTPYVSYDALPFTLTKANVIGSPTYTNVANVLIGFTADGYLMQYSATVVGAANTTYYTTFAVNTGYEIGSVSGSFIETSNPITTTYAISRDISVPARFGATYVTVNTSNHVLSVIYEVVNFKS